MTCGVHWPRCSSVCVMCDGHESVHTYLVYLSVMSRTKLSVYTEELLSGLALSRREKYASWGCTKFELEKNHDYHTHFTRFSLVGVTCDMYYALSVIQQTLSVGTF